jgi:hypothetical protein
MLPCGKNYGFFQGRCSRSIKDLDAQVSSNCFLDKLIFTLKTERVRE